jgi:chromosome segregation protein
MLKAIELVGFKSFADKCSFEFPPGITVIVGPNGSGKSNVVDALKWVLGEQSPKSLRGKDMTDVIFKGTSGPNGRRPANSAEATVILENRTRHLPFDTDEVHITRRVYRSGESEYLLNRETCRLKDIKNLFRGTGVGTDAYSLIEQGKVDQLLQASATDRRMIFEEAAGISRFKAKKIESERRLARVENNLVRLADIVEEVGNRYRSVKAQASKAVRYKEYNDRMRILRTYVGSIDWKRLSGDLQNVSLQRKNLQSEIQSLQQTLEKNQKQESALLEQISQQSEYSEKSQSSYNDLVQKISSLESIVSANTSRKADLQERIDLQNDQLKKLRTRQLECENRLKNNTAEFEKAELDFGDTKQQLEKQLDDQTELTQSIEQINASIAEHQAALDLRIQELNSAEKKRESENAKRESEIRSIAKLTDSLRDANELIEKTNAIQSDLTESAAALEKRAESKDSTLTATRDELKRATQDHETAKNNLEDLFRKQVGMSQRADVIQEMEKRLEGVGAGVKRLLSEAREATSGPLSEIVGMVADLLRVNVQHASLVDLALGEITQFIVVDGDQLIDSIADGKTSVKGRTGIVKVGAPVTLNAAITDGLNGFAGVIGRLDSLVEVIDGPHQKTLENLLAGTWVVKDLSTALDLFDQISPRVRFVTLNNQILESDGTLLIGPRDANSGLISRRSELRALQRELTKVQADIEIAQIALAETEKNKLDLEQQFQQILSEQTELASQIAEQNAKLQGAKNQLELHQSQLNQIQAELSQVRETLGSTDASLAVLNSQISECDGTIEQLTNTLNTNKQRLTEQNESLAATQREITTLKVKLAKCEQQLDDWGERQQHANSELTSIRQDIDNIESELTGAQSATDMALQKIQEATLGIDALCQQRDSIKTELDGHSQHRKDLEQQRHQLTEIVGQTRGQLDKQQAGFHQAEIKERQWKLEIDQLHSRMLEDYGIDVSNASDQPPENLPESREEIDQEIDQLRRKISNIGAVNMDALNELEELEQRFNHLNSQYEDMVNAKESLERLIHRINGECRKLYVETLDIIRTNFQELFRKTFGGGKADIILEEGVDPLEAGVELIATPPGKTSFNNSLLSGGEKAMTAVALLMAIFQFRPSPFCVLDEVDAPFDEANIGRFLDVLKSFLSWTKFVIVTHSKKTMTAADTLYGVTMQESGVSTRVSVRFEDVSEGGHISAEATKKDTATNDTPTDDQSQRGVA